MIPTPGEDFELQAQLIFEEVFAQLFKIEIGESVKIKTVHLDMIDAWVSLPSRA